MLVTLSHSTSFCRCRYWFPGKNFPPPCKATSVGLSTKYNCNALAKYNWEFVIGISTDINPGHVEIFCISFWLRGVDSLTQDSNHLRNGSGDYRVGEGLGQVISTCAQREMPKRLKWPRVMPVDVTVAKLQSNMVKWLKRYDNKMYLFDKIGIRDLTGWGNV